MKSGREKRTKEWLDGVEWADEKCVDGRCAAFEERGRALESEWQTGYKLHTGWEAAWKFNKVLINSKKPASR